MLDDARTLCERYPPLVSKHFVIGCCNRVLGRLLGGEDAGNLMPRLSKNTSCVV